MKYFDCVNQIFWKDLKFNLENQNKHSDLLGKKKLNWEYETKVGIDITPNQIHFLILHTPLSIKAF